MEIAIVTLSFIVIVLICVVFIQRLRIGTQDLMIQMMTDQLKGSSDSLRKAVETNAVK